MTLGPVRVMETGVVILPCVEEVSLLYVCWSEICMKHMIV